MTINLTELEHRQPPKMHRYLTSIPRGTWIAFSRKVKREYGPRQANFVITELIHAFVLGRIEIAKPDRHDL